MMKNFKTVLIQTDIFWHEIRSNLEHVEKLMSSVDPENSLVVLPEMFTTGFTMDPELLAEDMNSVTVTTMKRWSQKYSADIAGSVIIEDNNQYYNRLVWTSPDGVVKTYDKRHLFRIAHENEIYTPGKTNILVERDGWKIRPFICYDLRFPVCTRNTNPLYDILLFSANWPGSRQNHWEALLRARAIENQCYVIGVNRSGIDGKGLQYKGGSVIYDFKGEIIARAGESEEVIQCTLEYDSLNEYRQSFPFWMDADHFIIS